MNKPRVLLADDHTLVLDGFRKLLEDRCEIVGVAEDGRTLLQMAQELEPDIVTLDISMPQLNGVDAARKLKKILPRTKLIFVTMHADQAYVSEAFKAGASGYLLKRSAGSELLQAIQSVMDGQCYVTPLVAKGLVAVGHYRKDACGSDGQALDCAPTRSVATRCRREDGQGDCVGPQSLTEDRRVSQIADHDATRSSHDSGADKVRPQPWPPRIGLTVRASCPCSTSP